MPCASHAQAPNLGSAATFAVLAGSTVTNTGTSILTGNLGVSPGSSITGFPPGIVLAPGAIHIADAVAVQAQIDLTIGYNALASRPPTRDLTGQNLGGLTLTPGVYNFSSSAQLTGNLTLNALGNPNAVFIFNIGSTLTTASSATVQVIGGGNANNVYWKVGSSATLGTATSFVGDILALTSITLNTGANIRCGSALAQNGAVTLDTNTIGIRNLTPCLASLLPVTPVAPGEPSPVPPVTLPVVTTIENAFASTGGAMPQAFLNLSALSPSELANALQQLSGEAGTGFPQAGFQTMNSFLSLTLSPFAGNPLADSRNGFGPAAPAGPVRALGFAPEGGQSPDIVSAYAAMNKASVPPTYGYDQRRWSAWGAAYGGASRTTGDSSFGVHDRSARTYGLASGFDYRVTPDTVVGVALAGGGVNYGLSDGLGGGHSDLFQAAVYSTTRFNAAYISAALAYAWHWVTTDRYLSVAGLDHLSGDFVATNLGGRLEGGYRFAIPAFFGKSEYGITPYGAVQAQSIRAPSYSERAVTGSSVFALDYSSRTAATLRTEIGAWFDQTVLIRDDALLVLRFRAAWAHDQTSDPTINAAFQSLPGSAFIVAGAQPVTDLALLSAAAQVRFARGITVGAKFDGEFSGRQQSYAGTGMVRYSW
jgi:uncharacterized protein with beta-barrel porin domain